MKQDAGEDDPQRKNNTMIGEDTNLMETQDSKTAGCDEANKNTTDSPSRNSKNHNGISHPRKRYQPNRGFRRYNNALRSLRPIGRKNSRSDGTVPVDNAGLFSHMIYAWLSRYIYRAYKYGFIAEEWPPLSSDDKSDPNTDRLEAFWQDELARQGPEKASLGRVTWRFIGTRTVIATLVYSLSVLFAFVSQLLLMSKLLEHLESEDATYGESVKFAALFVLVEVLRLLFYGWSWTLYFQTAVRYRLAFEILLYRKVIRLKDLENTNIGELVNMFSNDTVMLAQFAMGTPLMAATIIVIVCGVWYISTTLGFMALLGILIFISYAPIQNGISCIVGYLRSKIMKIADSRVNLTSEIISCMKLVKMYAWEKRFCEHIFEIRKKEERRILEIGYGYTLSNALANTIPAISMIITVVAHVSTGKNLTAAHSFPISCFFANQMAQALQRVKDGYQVLVDAQIAFKRFKSNLRNYFEITATDQIISDHCVSTQKVLLIEEDLCPVSKPILKSQAIFIDLGTFAYHMIPDRTEKNPEKCKDERNNIEGTTEGEGKKMNLAPESSPRIVKVLFDVTFEIGKGKLIGICGQVGSGKSSLLLATLGQLRKTGGRVMRDGTCAYVSQQAWIINATLRNNILFGRPFDAEWYARTLHVCSLNHDLEVLSAGDYTEIGERGINLSGGQKQRVALARALYADKDIYFLDDPLSAVDAYVGQHIFNNLILEALHDKTVLFVTHQIQYLDRCDEIYMMRDGRIVEHGTHCQLMELDQEYAVMVNAISDGNGDTTKPDAYKEAPNSDPRSNEVISREMDNQRHSHDKNDQEDIEETEDLIEAKGTLIQAEESEEGTVKMTTFQVYASAAGGWLTISWIILLTILAAGSSSFSSWWLATWLNAGGGNITDSKTNVTVWSENINDNPDFDFYQTIYGASLGLILVTNLYRSVVFCKACARASTTLHNKLFEKIMSLPMRFFDTTPAGRIQNLFSRNMGDIDARLPFILDVVTTNTVMAISAFVVMCGVFPWLILAVLVAGGFYYFYATIYRTTSRGLIRKDMLCHAPILSHVTATIQGLNTIHAFDKDEEFETNFVKLAESNCGYFFLELIANRWLTVRLDGLSLLTTCVTLIVILVTKNQVSPAMAGLALASSVSVSGIFQYAIRLLSDAEMRFISVERMNSYITLPETDGGNEKDQIAVSPDWPGTGTLKFEDVLMAYAEGSPFVLKGVSFAIEPREKIGILGRTGSGKSSLTVALFRLVELSGGSITIDDVDISRARIDQLRSRLSIIPQEPILFSGPLRSHLDPFKDHTDAIIWDVLEKIQLKDRVESITGQLSASVGFGGDNFSVGERQLLCLGRALLKHSKILILDEATASVDPETEIAIQNTIQQEFADSTVLTIAHRLQTVVSCDRILVMDDGQVAEFDKPSTLLADENSHFSKMMAAAEKAMQR